MLPLLLTSGCVPLLRTPVETCDFVAEAAPGLLLTATDSCHVEGPKAPTPTHPAKAKHSSNGTKTLMLSPEMPNARLRGGLSVVYVLNATLAQHKQRKVRPSHASFCMATTAVCYTTHRSPLG